MISKRIIFGAGILGVGRAHVAGPPNFFVDNDSSKWGSIVAGVPVESPEVLRQSRDFVVEICVFAVKDVLRQLEAMGIDRARCIVPPKTSGHSLRLEEREGDIWDTVRMACEALSRLTPVMPDMGTLLGLFRDEALLPHDNDVDLMVVTDEPEAAARAVECAIRDYRGSQRYSGFTFLNRCGVGEIGFLLDGRSNDALDGVPFTISCLKPFGQHVQHPWFAEEVLVPKKFILPPREARDLGFQLLFWPADPSKYLQFVYGPTWRVPNPTFTAADYAVNPRSADPRVPRTF